MHNEIVVKKSNRRTISLSVTDGGIVFVRAPKNVSNEYIHKFINDKKDWIEKSVTSIKKRNDKAERFKQLVDKDKIKSYREKVREILMDRTNFYAETFNLEYQKIRISSAKARWGSCSGGNNLNFNWKIFFAPPEVQDYLVAHELAHTVHKNHKKTFWNLVEKMHPDYKKARSWLRENSHILKFS